jgi:hypothetical protein
MTTQSVVIPSRLLAGGVEKPLDLKMMFGR